MHSRMPSHQSPTDIQGPGKDKDRDHRVPVKIKTKRPDGTGGATVVADLEDPKNNQMKKAPGKWKPQDEED